MEVNIYEAKTNLSKYIELLESGEETEIVITRYDKKVAVLSLYEEIDNSKNVGAAIGYLEKMPFEVKNGFEDVLKEFD